MSTFFSVIIPTFNRAQTIRRAIESVLRQSYKEFELIVVDDGSNDETEELVKEYEGRLLYYKIVNKGVSHARNFGVSKSKGTWLCFLDSDDEWLEDKLKLQAQKISENDSPLVHTEEIWIRNGVRVNQMKKHKKGGGDQFIPSLSLCLISPSSVAIKRELFLSLGGFNENLPCCEDYDLWLKITSQNEVAFIEEPLIKKYGGHEDQLSRKYVAMDYYRVKSMHDLASSEILSSRQLNALSEILRKKCEVLLRGYKKHNNLDNYSEVEFILSQYEL